MSVGKIVFSVFTKPWKTPIPELAAFVRSLGFDAIEYPVRPGYPVHPENAAQELPRAVNILADHNLKIASIAGPTDEATIALCAELRIPVLRVMANIGNAPYRRKEAEIQREYDALLPLLERYGVTLGVQNHVGKDVCNAMGLRSLIGKYDPRRIAAIWDAAHNALSGEEPELALDIVWDRLCMINFKNAYWRRVNGPEAQEAKWSPYWTSGRHGLASWSRVAQELKRRDFSGVVCLTAEYSDEASVDRLIAEDIVYARSLFAEGG
jgi:sugar phosphate isomerase/epimerase